MRGIVNNEGGRIIEVGQNPCQSTDRPVESDRSGSPDCANIVYHQHMINPVLDHLSDLRSSTAVAAFFDVDNTLLPGVACEIRFFRFLWSRGVVGWRELGESIWWLFRKSRSFSLHPLREHKLYLAGKRSSEIERLAEEFCRSEMIPKVSPQGLERLEHHRRAGHQIILVTGAPDFLVAPLAAFLGVTTVFSAKPIQQDFVYTGELAPPLPYGQGKQALILVHVREKGIDLATSFAYGDSPGDIETLKLVGHPLVINPIRGMHRLARRQGWVIERWT
jgi:HAD superfamily hydrolase (TIGR01490 family)